MFSSQSIGIIKEFGLSLKHIHCDFTDFVVVGDCKLSSEENLLAIAKGEGYFLAPLAMYSTLKKELISHVLLKDKTPILLKTQQRDGGNS